MNRSPNSTIFHSPEFIDIQREVFDFDIYVLISEKCIFPIFKNKVGIFTIYGSPLPEIGSFYGGPVCTNRFNYLDILKNLKFGFLGGLFSTFFLKTPCDVEPSFPENYEWEPVKNYILDMQDDIEDLWKNLNKKTRNAIRKAERSGVIVKIRGVEYLSEYTSMVEEVIKRRPHTPIPYKMMQRVIEKDIGRLFIAYCRGKPAAGGIFLTFKDTVTYWSGASFNEFRKYQPSNLLHWEVIKWAVEEGYKYYDLGGAEIPSIARFKRGWGGREVYYYRVYRRNILTKISRDLYKFIKKRK